MKCLRYIHVLGDPQDFPHRNIVIFEKSDPQRILALKFSLDILIFKKLFWTEKRQSYRYEYRIVRRRRGKFSRWGHSRIGDLVQIIWVKISDDPNNWIGLNCSKRSQKVSGIFQNPFCSNKIRSFLINDRVTNPKFWNYFQTLYFINSGYP